MARIFSRITSWNFYCCCKGETGVKVIAGISLLGGLLGLGSIIFVLRGKLGPVEAFSTKADLSKPDHNNLETSSSTPPSSFHSEIDEYELSLFILDLLGEIANLIFIILHIGLSVYLFIAAEKKSISKFSYWIKTYVKLWFIDTGIFIFLVCVGVHPVESIILFIIFGMLDVYCVLWVLKYKYELEDELPKFGILSEDRNSQSFMNLEDITIADRMTNQR